MIFFSIFPKIPQKFHILIWSIFSKAHLHCQLLQHCCQQKRWLRFLVWICNSGSTVIEHSPQHPKIKGSRPAATSEPGEIKWQKECAYLGSLAKFPSIKIRKNQLPFSAARWPIRLLIISWSVCPCHAFPAKSNVCG
jgi:hypothetical protein